MSKVSFGKYIREPVWRMKSQFMQSQLPAGLADWLYDKNSLTQRLQGWCDGEFRVQVYNQQRQRPMRNEAIRLGMSEGQSALVRQVHLYCGDQAVVFARTIIPPGSLVGKQRRLAFLGQRSLGAVLFADKSMQRSEMEIAKIGPKQYMHSDAMGHVNSPSATIWGRRSVFTLRGHPLLVSEIFLPPISQETDP